MQINFSHARSSLSPQRLYFNWYFKKEKVTLDMQFLIIQLWLHLYSVMAMSHNLLHSPWLAQECSCLFETIHTYSPHGRNKNKKNTCDALLKAIILTNVFSKTDLSWKIKYISRKNNTTRETLSRFILSNSYEETERAILEHAIMLQEFLQLLQSEAKPKTTQIFDLFSRQRL